MSPKTAFVTFKNPFASFLAKKMMAIQKEEIKKEEDRAKLFGRPIRFSGAGYPSDTQYINYGFTTLERYLNYFLGLVLFFVGAQIFMHLIFVTYQLVQNNR